MPQSLLASELVIEWRQLCECYSPEIRQSVLDTVHENREFLVELFYERMMLDAASSFYLSDEIVKTRLHKAMERWLQDVFELGINSKFEEAVARQRAVGEAHARIGIPVHLVMRGMRCIDAALYELYAAASSPMTMRAVAYISQTTSMAIEIMCRTYEVSHDRNARAEESYRLFAMAQDIGAEKERQRAALYDWENQLMFDISMRFSKVADTSHLNDVDPALVYIMPLPLIHKSEFGLWFVHKGAHIFEGSPDIAALSAVMDDLDRLLLSKPENAQRASTHLAELMANAREKTQFLRFLLDQMFQQAGHIENGRDTLTNLLSRKYLQVILTREIDQARRSNAALSVLTIDIDYFKRINDTYGHDAGDLVLQQVAQCLTGLLRGGDYIFRLGGEEFLVILVEANIDQAMSIAEDIRQQFASERLQLPSGGSVNATFSIGVACHDGHPDYQRLLKQSDLALYEAKRAGRNRVVAHRVAGFQSALNPL